MAHERQLLREAIVAALTGRTAAGSRVFKSREVPATIPELPIVLVYNDDEVVREGSQKSAPRELERQYRVTIVGIVTAIDPALVDDLMDAIALEIETAMDLDVNFDRHAFDSWLAGTAFTIDLSGEQPLGAIALTYECTYFSQMRVAAPVDNFDTAAADVSLAGEQADADQTRALVTNIY